MKKRNPGLIAGYLILTAASVYFLFQPNSSWMWMVAGVISLSALAAQLLPQPKETDISALRELSHIENPTSQEIKEYRKANPGTSFSEALIALKRERADALGEHPENPQQ
ncbi:hypothetical protein ACUH9O_05865 [Dermabacteraceae bacterium P13103]